MAVTVDRDGTMQLYRWDAEEHQLVHYAELPVAQFDDPEYHDAHGICLWQPSDTSALFAYIVRGAGGIEQFRIDFVAPHDSSGDQPTAIARHMRRIEMPANATRCVADDTRGQIYAGTASGSIFRLQGTDTPDILHLMSRTPTPEMIEAQARERHAERVIEYAPRNASVDHLMIGHMPDAADYLIVGREEQENGPLYRLPDLTPVSIGDEEWTSVRFFPDAPNETRTPMPSDETPEPRPSRPPRPNVR